MAISTHPARSKLALFRAGLVVVSCLPPTASSPLPEIGFVSHAPLSRGTASHAMLSSPQISLPSLALFRVVGLARSDAVRRFVARPSRPCLLPRIGFVSHAMPVVVSSLPPPASSLLQNWLCFARRPVRCLQPTASGLEPIPDPWHLTLSPQSGDLGLAPDSCSAASADSSLGCDLTMLVA